MTKAQAMRILAILAAMAVLAGLAVVFTLALVPRAQTRPEDYLVYSLADVRDIPEKDILYREADPVKVPLAPGEELYAVCLLPGPESAIGLAAAGGKRLFIFGPDRALQLTIDAGEPVSALAAGSGRDAGRLYAICGDHVVVFGLDGELLDEWAPLGERARLSSIVFSGSDGLVYAADAGNRHIVVFDRGGRVLRFIALETPDGTGFIVPGSCFDIVVNGRGALWAADPGRRRVVQVDARGEVIRAWGKTGTAPGEFYGCCNPTHIALLPDGGFAAQEKGLLRVTLFDPAGRFTGVAIGPRSFHESNTYLDLAAAPDGSIILADPRRNEVRIFSRKEAVQ